MLDLNRTVQLVRGALVEPEATWRSYLPEAGDWQKTAFLLTGPLIVAAALVAYVLGFLGGSSAFLGLFRPTLVSTLLGIVMMAIAAGVVAFVWSALSGVFGGKSGFALGLAATTLAFVPGYLGHALSGLPWIGTLLAIALGIWALIRLWKIIPIYFEVPDSKRGGYYVISVIATIVVMFIVNSVITRALYGSVTGPAMSDLYGEARVSGDEAASGMFGGVARQAELMAMAEEDEYAPPENGKLTDRQVRDFLRVMERATELRNAQGERLREIADRAEKEEEMSLSDFSQMMGGMSEVAGLQTAEMEVVKSAGGNWAEHQWVRESLRTAWIQKDLNEAVAHNYALFQQHEQELTQYMAP